MIFLFFNQEIFTMHADKYQPHSWFYTMSHEVIKHDIKPPNETAIFVYKEDDAFFFEGTVEISIFYLLFLIGTQNWFT